MIVSTNVSNFVKILSGINANFGTRCMWDQFLVQKAAAAVLVVVLHVLHIVSDKPFQNALKCTIKHKSKNFLGRGHSHCIIQYNI